MNVLLKLFDFLRSAKLALCLFILILIACIVGVMILPPPLSRPLVFSSLWFNALLVLLVINTACCFFSRIHRRGWSIVTAGMIIFHLSFVAIFTGVIVDSLFYFKGSLRLTEGETIRLGDSRGYDDAKWGIFFKHSWMKGDVTFHKLITDYMVGNDNKGAANEISVVAGAKQARDVIFPTQHLAFNDFKFFRNTDGFAPLFVLYDSSDNIIYGAYTPLQSFRMKDKTILYSTGTKQHGPGSIDFPQIQNKSPLFKIQFIYDLPKLKEDIPKAIFKVWEYDKTGAKGQGKLVYEGNAPLGKKISFGSYALSMKERRYWASMDVLYNPGQPIVFVSFWAALAGLSLTLYGRMRQRSRH